ncbi:unnamed protein product [Lactuca virosa]|uniref:PB1 domain-containing protein n=1 Tax=Lactuca virosa TaxID=75947 RepID=A0AAU9MMV3_9ASTR|nr:unnamed protein product [Lactuca virosa]
MDAYTRGVSRNIRMDSHTMMDIDSWTCEMRSQSDLAMSYSSGAQPPSIGNVRPIVVSEPSGSSQMYSDGQPPSVNGVCRQAPSQSEASCTRYEGPDEHEVQQVIYKRGANDITAYSGHDDRTQDLVSGFSGSNVFQSVGVKPMILNSLDLAINENGYLNSSVPVPPPQRFQQVPTYVKVYKRGAGERSIDISAYSGFYYLKQELARIFGMEGQLDYALRSGWQLAFLDHDNGTLLLGDDPWEVFVKNVQCIKILSPQEVFQIAMGVERF